MGDESGIIIPTVTISNKVITFSYDPLSSYLPIGAYSIEDDLLTLTTNDGKYKYVFLIDKDKLFFKKNQSSEVKLTDSRIGIEIGDNTEFKLEND